MDNSYEEKLILSRLETVRARLDGMDIAIDVKTREMDRRLESLNDLRAEVVRDRDQYARKEIMESKFETFDQWRHDIIHRVTIIETRSAVMTSIVGIVFLVFQVVVYYILRR